MNQRLSRLRWAVLGIQSQNAELRYNWYVSYLKTYVSKTAPHMSATRI